MRCCSNILFALPIITGFGLVSLLMSPRTAAMDASDSPKNGGDGSKIILPFKKRKIALQQPAEISASEKDIAVNAKGEDGTKESIVVGHGTDEEAAGDKSPIWGLLMPESVAAEPSQGSIASTEAENLPEEINLAADSVAAVQRLDDCVQGECVPKSSAKLKEKMAESPSRKRQRDDSLEEGELKVEEVEPAGAELTIGSGSSNKFRHKLPHKNVVRVEKQRKKKKKKILEFVRANASRQDKLEKRESSKRSGVINNKDNNKGDAGMGRGVGVRLNEPGVDIRRHKTAASDIKCYKCDKPGHYSHDCGPPSNNQSKNCYNCGLPGHFIRNCPCKIS